MIDLNELVMNHPASKLAMESLLALDGTPTQDSPLLTLAILGMEKPPASPSEYLDQATQLMQDEPASQALMLAEDFPTANEEIEEGTDPSKVLQALLDDLAEKLLPLTHEGRAYRLGFNLMDSLAAMYPDLRSLNACNTR